MIDIEYEVIFSDRKKLGLTIERDGSVIVRAPSGTTQERIDSFVKKKRQWIKEKQDHPQKYRLPRPIKEFVSGESILYLGQSYRLEFRDVDKAQVKLIGEFFVCDPRQAKIKERLRDWFVDQAKRIIPPRVNVHAQNMGVNFNEILISDMMYRWGSCTARSNLNFNWRLIKAPMHVIDYVIVHELAHILEHNHSPRFWQHVKTQTPSYETSKVWLLKYGQCVEEEF